MKSRAAIENIKKHNLEFETYSHHITPELQFHNSKRFRAIAYNF